MSDSCPRCRSPREDGDLRCAICGSQLEPPEEPRATPTVRFLRCTACGASMGLRASAGTLACAFCDAELVVRESSDPLEEVEATLPFRVGADAARQALATWIRGLGPLRPSDLAQKAKVESLRPTTWVGWVFDARATISWTADSDHDARRSDWAPHAGQTRLVFDDLVVSASRGLEDREVEGLIASYDLSQAEPEPALPTETVVERFDVQRSQARARILSAIAATAAERLQASGEIPGSRFRNVHVEPLVTDLDTRRLAFPAWILAWRYDGDLYRTVISGHDAAFLVGRAPWSFWKIAGLVALGLVLVGVVIGLAVS